MESVTKLPPDLEILRTEIRTFLRELPRLLADGHEGRHALIKGEEVLSIWDTFEDAYQAGRDRFPLGEAFLAQVIDPRFFSYPWGEDMMPRNERGPHEHPEPAA
jgi:hypothetical protein